MIFISCNRAWAYTRNPTAQYNTKWISDDKSITFSVDNNGNATGTMILDNQVLKFCLYSDVSGIYIYTLDQDGNKSENMCESWLGSYKSKKKFVATVKETTYFQVGQKMTFYQIDICQGTKRPLKN